MTMLKLKMSPRKRPMQGSDDPRDNLLAMMRQESTYQSVDYLGVPPSKQGHYHDVTSVPIDEFCREQICEWTFRVVDYFRIDREVVSISLNYLDRFLGTCKGECDRSLFKLAATTTLYMAVKVFYPHKIGDLGILSDLSRGEFDMRDVADMELHILRCLKWNLHPPTSAAFGQILLDYLNVKLQEVDDLYANTAFFSELAVCDYYFVCVSPSTVGLACILNALEGMMGTQTADLVVLEQVRSLRISKRDLDAARSRLWELYERSEECALHHGTPEAPSQQQSVPASSTSPREFQNVPASSPVSVATVAPARPKPTLAQEAMLQQHGSW